MRMFGCDYGVKPLMIILGDTESPDFLGSKDFLALVYDQIPDFGLYLANIRTTFLFSNSLFEPFQK